MFCVVVERPNDENDWQVTEVWGPYAMRETAEAQAAEIPETRWPMGHATIHEMHLIRDEEPQP